ncbi:MAG: flippase [Desulfitobacteriaceae bacterium]
MWESGKFGDFVLVKISQLSTGKRIIKNFFSLTTANLLGQFMSLITVPYLARTLGADGFGKIAFAQGIIVYFGIITDFGLRTIGVREVAKNKDEIKRYVSNILGLRFALAITSFILVLAFLVFINKPADYKTLIFLYGLTLFTQVFLLDWAFEGTEQMELVGIAQVIRAAIYLLLVFLVVKSSKDLLNVPILYFVSFLVMAIVLSCIFIWEYGWFSFSLDLKFWKNLIMQALPLGFSGFLFQVNSNIDIVILGFIRSDKEVGWYSAAYKVILLLIGFGSVLGVAVFPVMSRYYKESIEKLTKLIYYHFKLMIFFGLSVAVGGIILAPKIINLFYGVNYQESILAFQILLGYLFLSYIMAPFFFLLQASGKMRYFLYIAFAAAITNVCLNIILIPKYSLIGAAVATVMSNLVIFIALYVYSSRKMIRVLIGRSFLVAAIASLGMGILVYLIDLSLFADILFGFVSYIAIVGILGGVTIKELKYLIGNRQEID